MKTYSWCYSAAVLAGLLGASCLWAAETATVKAKTVNVRAQPSIFSEVVTQIKQGEAVIVLEELTLKKPKPEDETRWSRIQMPPNTPVWVNSTFVEPTKNTVKPPRLNLRAGPGENYSVVGVVLRDEVVKPIRTVETWTEIECPTNAFAFVASDLLVKGGALAAPTNPVAEAKPAEAVPPAKEEPATNAPPAIIPVVTSTGPPLPAVDQAAKPAEKMTETNAVPLPQTKAEPPAPETPSLANPPSIATPPANAAPIEPLPAVTNAMPIVVPPPIAPAPAKAAASLPRRVVRREGIVSGFVSIVAPAPFELKNADNGRVMDYLLSTSTNIVLKKYRGKKVVVTGEESLDERWQGTPLMKVETLEVAP